MRVAYLDGIRGVLALVVAINHAYGIYDGWKPDRLFSGASLAVTYFFILSGFVLSINLDKRHTTFFKFFMARFLRLWPIYAICLSITLLIFSFNNYVGSFVPYKILDLKPVLSNYFFLVNIGVNDYPVFNGPSWSIGIEFWVSAIFLYFIFFAPSTLVAIIILFGYGLVWKYSQLTNGAMNIFPYVNSGMVTAIAGMSLGCFCHRYNDQGCRILSSFPRWVLSIIYYLCAITCTYALLNPNGQPIDFFYILPFSIFLFNKSFSTSGGILSRIFDSYWMRWLGWISFSLYLIHMPLLILTVKYKSVISSNVSVQVALFLLLAVGIAYLLKKFVEIPIEKMAHTILRASDRRDNRPINANSSNV